MPKASRGGRRTATTSSPTGTTPTGQKIWTNNNGQQMVWNAATQSFVPYQPQQQTNQPQDDDDENTLSATQSGEENADFNDFRKMTDDEKADVIKAALQSPPPSFLPDNASQRLLWHLGGDNKPTIVPDQQFKSMSGAALYRQVAGVHDSKLGTNLTSQQIANQVMTGDLTQYAQDWGAGSTGAGGGTAYGRAIYFGTDYDEIKRGYGTARNVRGKQDSTMFACKINPQSRGMSYNALHNAVAKEVNSGSKLGRTLRGIGNSDDRATIYALAKGIDYTYAGGWGNYHMIYNRGCLVASSKLKHNTTDSSW